MIPLKRVRTPAAVHPNFRGAKRVELNLSLLRKKLAGDMEAAGKTKWDSSVWAQAKDQLLRESNQKCAYCESPTTVVAYGDVEHFRPKSIYWWLAYSYENYLPSCTVCNQRFKKDLFPVLNKSSQLKGPAPTAGMAEAKLKEMARKMTVDPVNDSEGLPLQNLVAQMQSEQALIVNPYFENPADYFAYKPILENKEVLVVPAQAKYKGVIKACETCFGINRKELTDLRFIRYCEYMTFKHTLASTTALPPFTLQMIRNRLTEMKADFSAYAGMIRYFETKALTDLPWDFNLVIG